MDREFLELLEKERKRAKLSLNLIASENYVSDDVLEALGSDFHDKYSEGYPGKRYYAGCKNMNSIERLAQERLKKLFNVSYANVQPHSGSQANMAVLFALLKPGDAILSMDLNAGGHLTHGFKLSFSGQLYSSTFYGVDKNERIDYKEVERLALKHRPKIIIAGASSYSREIDFAKFKEIANKAGAYLLADIAHIAGLVAASLHNSPIGLADVITFTTHKTLRGPKGGAIVTNSEEIYKKVNRALFPGIQGGPLMNNIAAKAISFGEALDPDFKDYQNQILKNCKALLSVLEEEFRVVSGGSDNHMFLLDLNSSGRDAQELLEGVNIVVNKNVIPFESRGVVETSGLRLGTPALTTRGFKESHMETIGEMIIKRLKYREYIKKDVEELAGSFLLRQGRGSNDK